MDYLLEDFLVPGNTKPIKKAIRHAFSNTDSEVFGFFVISEDGIDCDFIASKNADIINRDHFVNDDNNFYNYFLNNRIISLFHTHVSTGCNPSDLDISISESFGLPSYILSTHTKSSYLYYPSSHQSVDLYDRQFIPIFQDCITFVKDFYKNAINVDLSLYIKNWARDRNNSNDKLMDIVVKNFTETNLNSLLFGDLIIFKPQHSGLFHVGIYKDNGQYVHHPINQKPRIELLTEQTLNQVYKVYRYKD